MNRKLRFAKITIFLVSLLWSLISSAEDPVLLSASSSKRVNITVINDSDVSLMPTAEGLMEGCIGGSLPPFFSPIEPHTTRKIDLVFIQYLPQCQFNVLPVPNIISYFQACHQVKKNDTVTFTGYTLASLRCNVN